MPNRNELVMEMFGSIYEFNSHRNDNYSFMSFRNKITIRIYESTEFEGGKCNLFNFTSKFYVN